MDNRVGIGKQNHFKYVPYIVTCVDLLGYGSMLKNCRFVPTSADAEKAVERLEQFNNISLKHASPSFPILQMNDGIIAWRELSFRTKSVTQDFLARSIEFFYSVTEIEKLQGYPGPRMVISTGIRMKMNNLHKAVANQRAQKLLDKISEGSITVEKAIYQACSYQDYCNGVDALQANFAFTKSYLAEDSGSAGGISGNNIYIDLAIFDNSDIKCLDIAAPFVWDKCPGLETTFAKINMYSRDTFMEHSMDDIASTYVISKRITTCKEQDDVVQRLKNSLT